MEEEQPSRKLTSDETNLFWEIFERFSSKQFYRNVREKSIHLPMKYLVSLLLNLRVQ